jgi:hypothetical protein
MNLLDPKYIKSFLNSKYPFKAVIRDYSKIKGLEDKYPIWGICVLGFYYEKDISVRISVLPSNQINFYIEVEQNTLLDCTYSNDDIDESVYEYYMFIIDKIISTKAEISDHMRKFSSKYWVKRNKLLSNFV